MVLRIRCTGCDDVNEAPVLGKFQDAAVSCMCSVYSEKWYNGELLSFTTPLNVKLDRLMPGMIETLKGMVLGIIIRLRQLIVSGMYADPRVQSYLNATMQ